MKGSVSRRYAKALFALAKEKGVLEPTADELARLGSTASNPDLAPVLRSPLLSPSRRSALAKTLIDDLRLSDLLGRFVQLLADRQRLADLPGIADFFLKFLDEEKNRVRLDVEFLRPISEFSVNVNSDYSSALFYTVRTDEGYETKSIWFGAIHSYDYHTLQVTAPEGGYLTSFYFSQADRGGVEVVMDNLNYTVAAHVPDTMGTLSGLAIALTCIGLVRYRFNTAKVASTC